MKIDLGDIDYYLVTDSGLSKHGTLYDVEAAIDAGCRIVQYREKTKDTRAMVEEAAAIGRICRGRALFVVNDRIDVALAVDADGVHVGQNDMPYELARRLLGDDRIIGLTTHSVDESVEAERLGADYIGLSPIFDTATKTDAGKGCGTGMVRNVREAVTLPIVAIGGISLANTGEVIASGADSVAAISAVLTDDDVAGRVREFIGVIRASRGSDMTGTGMISPKTNIVLTGMPGSGKSTIGVLLAKELLMDFIDTDVLIQTVEGCSLQDIVDTRGVNALLDIEERVVCGLAVTGTVIAPGGSVVLRQQAVDALKRSGTIVFLDVPLDEIAPRIDLHNRGTVRAPGDTLADIWRVREPYYRATADHTIACAGLTQTDVTRRIARLFR